MNQSFGKNFIPILLTIITFFILVEALYIFISLLNLSPIHSKIFLFIKLSDILVGLTIYLKTSIDFALFIGNLMKQYTGTKNRIAIEIGTALGNGLGTFVVLTIWTFFKEVPLLMILMITLASLILLRMAEDSIREFYDKGHSLPSPPSNTLRRVYWVLEKINKLFLPITSRLLPHSTITKKSINSFAQLLFFSFSIPFILGFDDFTGYIPLFSIINVFGFATGVFLGHMLLNMSLFSSRQKTIRLVNHPLIILFGSFVFIALSCIGFFEAIKLVRLLLLP